MGKLACIGRLAVALLCAWSLDESRARAGDGPGDSSGAPITKAAFAPSCMPPACTYKLANNIHISGPDFPLAIARSGSSGAWWLSLNQCQGRDKCTLREAVDCADTFGKFAAKTTFDRYGRAVAHLVHHQPAQLAACLGTADPQGLILRFVQQQKITVPAALEVRDSNLLEPGVARIIPGATYSIYVGARAATALLYAGSIVLGNGESALQALVMRRSAAWLAASWQTGELRFQIDEQVASQESQESREMIAEVRYGSATGNLWLQSPDGQRWRLLASHTSLEIALPEELYVHLKRMRWGESAYALAPTADEWKAMLRDVDICMPRTYVALSDPICQRLGDLVVWPRPSPMRLGISRTLRDLGSGELVEHARLFVSQSPAIITTSDQLAVDGRADVRGDLLQWCQDECHATLYDPRAVPFHGLVELRVASRASAQGLTLFRLWIIDPARDWTPSGVRRSAWGHAEADRKGVGFRRQAHHLGSRLSIPAGVAAVWRGDGMHVSEALLAPADPRNVDADIFTLVSFDGSCPRPGTASITDRIAGSRVVDQPSYLFLATRRNDVIQCLARATYSTWEARSKVAPAGDRLVVLGDPLLAIAPAEPAVSLMVPALTILSRSVAGARLELTGGVIAVRRLNDRFDGGAAVWLGGQWGPVRAPRLLAAGALGTVLFSGETAITSYVGLNIGALYDLVGGR